MAAVARLEDVNSRDALLGISALMWAVRNKLNSIVSLLLEQPGLDDRGVGGQALQLLVEVTPVELVYQAASIISRCT